MGIELESMLDTYLRYGGDDIKAYCIEYTDTMISPAGEIRRYNLKDYNLDNVRTGHFVTRMYEHFPEAKNLRAMNTLMLQLNDQPEPKRVSTGTRPSTPIRCGSTAFSWAFPIVC